MIAPAKIDIAEFDLSSAHDDVVTVNLLLSIFREMAQAATSAYVLKSGFLQDPFLEPVHLSNASEGKYFKIALRGEALVLSFNSLKSADLIAKHYSPSLTETPESLKKVATEVGELMAQQVRGLSITSAAIFLHDLQGILYLQNLHDAKEFNMIA